MNKTVIFVPYQDTDTYFSDCILTREYAMLYMLYEMGYTNVINVCKPRTLLDRKSKTVKIEKFPNNTIEKKVLDIIHKSKTVQYLPKFSFSQVLFKRTWWIKGYKKTISIIDKYVENLDAQNTIVYSDNPFAFELLSYLKQLGFKVYFDIMDNFAIHPSLYKHEQKSALYGYINSLGFADIVSANSTQTCEYMKKYRDNIFLIKNGVFINNEAEGITDIKIDTIRNKKKDYSKVIGYIGKIGKRLNADFIDELSKKMPDCLFVFVGEYLRDQGDQKLGDIFDKQDNNVLHIDKIPSAYVYAIMDEFDILSIPHSIGKSENGGDPLKLYQYLTRKKPIVTTPILGVDEFSDYIKISNDVDEWVEFINNPVTNKVFDNFDLINWESRFKVIKDEINHE